MYRLVGCRLSETGRVLFLTLIFIAHPAAISSTEQPGSLNVLGKFQVLKHNECLG